MKALIFNGTLSFTEDEPKPVPPKGEALIKILLAGICQTDIEITNGYMGFTGIPGHEFVGIVEKINHSDQSLLGKRVVGDINCACNHDDCYYCQKGLGRHCPGRTTLGISERNGCMAEYITLPIGNLYTVPETIPDETAVLTEPLAAGFEILEQINLSITDEVLIVGDGKLGILINHAISTTGARITHVGKHAEKLKLVEKPGSQTVLMKNMPSKQYDVVVEATGSLSGFLFSIKHTQPRGTLILKSTLASNQTIDLSPVVVNEITIIGSRCGLFPPAIDYLSKGADLTPLISAIFPANKALDAFEATRADGCLKVLIDFRNGA
jgi:alcohol dehydrogenase